VIPALIAGGGQYFGKNLTNMREVSVPPVRTASSASAAAQAQPEAYQLDKGFVDNLLKQEYVKISGQTD
jgi:hypothetical protein